MPFDNLPIDVVAQDGPIVMWDFGCSPHTTVLMKVSWHSFELEPLRPEPLQDRATYEARRIAAAEIWLHVDPDQFDMTNWDCCALGWLARRRHDGWHWGLDGRPARAGFSPYYDAAAYFGTTKKEAHYCFSGFIHAYPARVASKLLALTYGVEPVDV